MLLQTTIMAIIYGAVAGAGYALIFFAKAVQAGAESFDIMKFLRALVIGAIIGGITGFTGVPLTEQTYETQVLAYGFVTVIVDKIIKLLWRSRTTPPATP